MTDSDGSDDYSELLGEIYGPRRELIKAFDFFEGRVNSKRLFDVADAPRDSKYHYLTKLEELDLVEHTGDWEHAGQGGEAKVWQLTSLGETVAEDVGDADATTITDLEALEQRVTALERTVEGRADKETSEANGAEIEELREEVEQLRSDVQEVQPLLDELRSLLNGEQKA